MQLQAKIPVFAAAILLCTLSAACHVIHETTPDLTNMQQLKSEELTDITKTMPEIMNEITATFMPTTQNTEINTENLASSNSSQTTEGLMPTMYINEQKVAVQWENNEAVEALIKLCTEKDLEIGGSRYADSEQVAYLPVSLPSNDRNIRAKSGDLLLYKANSIVLMYGENSWSYTRLGHIDTDEMNKVSELLRSKTTKFRFTLKSSD